MAERRETNHHRCASVYVTVNRLHSHAMRTRLFIFDILNRYRHRKTLSHNIDVYLLEKNRKKKKKENEPNEMKARKMNMKIQLLMIEFVFLCCTPKLIYPTFDEL